MDSNEKWVVAEAIQSAIQAPVYHLTVELLLVLWIIRLLFFKSYKIEDKAPLTEDEKQEIINAWQPEPLVPPLEETLRTSKPYKVVSGCLGKEIVVNDLKCKNFASMNFLGFVGNEKVQDQASASIRKYGVGSCGPRGFYGTFDVHLELEKRLAKYMGVDEAIIYSYGFSAISSAIPAYSKRGDIVFADEAVCFAIQKGLQASRSKVIYFRHNDTQDLEKKLIAQEKLDRLDPKKAKVTRKFMVVEGIYMNSGHLCDLPKLVELKYKYKVRIILEESLSFGVLGEHGKGVTEHFDIPVDKIDLISCSLEYSLGSVGGFNCGRTFVVNHQRISGSGYVFSASLPPLLARAAIEGLNIMQETPDIFSDLRKKAIYFQEMIRKIPGVEVTGHLQSPCFHLKRKVPVSYEDDVDFLNAVVEQCADSGVCVTIASRLRHVELHKNWPPSIRLSVSVEMTMEDLDEAARVIGRVVQRALQK